MNAKKSSTLGLGILIVASLAGCSAGGESKTENSVFSPKQDTQAPLAATGKSIEMAIGATYKHLALPAEARYSFTRVTESPSARKSQLGAIKTLSGARNLREDLDSGLVSFDRGLGPSTANTVGLPDDSAADAKARTHLSRLGLLPEDDSQLFVEHIGGINNATYDANTGKTVIYKNFVTVNYGRKIGNLPVKGNSRIVVRLGKDGDVAQVIKRWTKVMARQAIPSTDIKSTDETVADMRKLVNVHYAAHSAGIKRLNVSAVQYVMYDDGKTIEPALAATGTIESSGHASPEEWIIPVSRHAKAHYRISDTIPNEPGPQQPVAPQP